VRAVIALLAAAMAGGAAAEENNFELKRQNTARGTPEETTKTSLRFERFWDGALRQLRLDVPLPDDRTDFEGSPFDPRLGDIAVRTGFRAVRAWGHDFPSFVELTLPTATSDDSGSGKYQLSLGLRMLSPPWEAEVQQVNSFAGDEAREDINHTKLELSYRRLFGTYTFKAKLKPSFDHVKEDDAAIAELEGGFLFGQGSRVWLMLGTRVWGPGGVAGTYQNRVELGFAHRY